MTDHASAEGLTPDSGLVWRQCICGAWYWGVAQTDGDKATSRALPDRASPEGLPRTEAGRKLLAREAYNSRSFALITAADIVAIEDEAALRSSESDSGIDDVETPRYVIVADPNGPTLADHGHKFVEAVRADERALRSSERRCDFECPVCHQEEDE